MKLKDIAGFEIASMKYYIGEQLTSGGWIKVGIQKLKDHFVLLVDGQRVRIMTFAQRRVTMSHHIFVGGLPKKIMSHYMRGTAPRVMTNFNGCVKDFSLNGEAIDLLEDATKRVHLEQRCLGNNAHPEVQVHFRRGSHLTITKAYGVSTEGKWSQVAFQFRSNQTSVHIASIFSDSENLSIIRDNGKVGHSAV